MANTFNLTGIQDRIANNEAFRALGDHLDHGGPQASIAPEYMDDVTVRLRDGSSLRTKIDAITQEHKAIEAAKKSLGSDYVEDVDRMSQLRVDGKKAHTELDELAKHADNVGKAIDKHHGEAVQSVQDALKARAISAEEAAARLEALKNERKFMEAARHSSGEHINKLRGDVKAMTGVESRGAVQTLSKIEGAVSAGAKSGDKIGMLKRATNNWKHGKGIGKAKVVVGALGLGTSLASGIKDFSSSVGEDGQEREARPVLGIFKIGVGGGLSLLLAGHGGAKLGR